MRGLFGQGPGVGQTACGGMQAVPRHGCRDRSHNLHLASLRRLSWYRLGMPDVEQASSLSLTCRLWNSTAEPM
jgi:hypothetical protein